jgi:hypothetical protein
MPKRDTDLFEISISQVRQYGDVDVIVGKRRGLSLQANLRQPLRNWLHCGSHPWTCLRPTTLDEALSYRIGPLRGKCPDSIT